MLATNVSKDHTNYPRKCGCKGIRTCLLCQNSSAAPSSDLKEHDQRIVYRYCIHCQKAWTTQTLSDSLKLPADVTVSNTPYVTTDGMALSETQSSCCHYGGTAIEFPGIDVFESFVNGEEEEELVKVISCTPFVKSQSGRHKQDFGPKVNFKKQKLKTGTFNGLPAYSHNLYKRMKDCKTLAEFEPVEMCNLEYTSDRGAHIDPHIDDTWVWGEKLVTLNLLSDSILSFTHNSQPDVLIQVPLIRRSLIVVSGPARYEWKHSIGVEHINGRRIAMTFRELADEFRENGLREKEGRELLDLALSFQGCAIGVVS